MQDNLKGTTVSSPQHPNAFTSSFLTRLAERDEPPTAGDADALESKPTPRNCATDPNAPWLSSDNPGASCEISSKRNSS